MTDSRERLKAILDADIPDYTEAIQAFQRMWGAFPGMARLMNKQHRVIAANARAVAMGYEPGVLCAKVKHPEFHKGCQLFPVLADGTPRVDCSQPGLVRGYLPVADFPDLCIHFVIETTE